MECRDCANAVEPEWKFCEACGAPVDPARQPVTSGRKWAARLLRFLGTMVIGFAMIAAWIALDSASGADRMGFIGLAVAAMVMGGGINYAGRRVNPHAGRVTISGVLGGLFGVAAAFLVIILIIGMLFMAAVAAFFSG